MITVYTKPSCQQCEATKRELKLKGIDFDTIDVTKNERAFDMIQSLGYRSMPVVITENSHWSGFQIDKLDML